MDNCQNSHLKVGMGCSGSSSWATYPTILRSWMDLPITKGKTVSLVTRNMGDAVDDAPWGKEHVGNEFPTGPKVLGQHFGPSLTWKLIGLCSTLGHPSAQSRPRALQVVNFRQRRNNLKSVHASKRSKGLCT